MNPQHLFADERFLGVCAYCGGSSGTRDHVPPRFLLDDPLPSNVPIVFACAKCNQGASLDEEYFGCFLESVIAGSTRIELLRREKVKKTLSRNDRLAERIRQAAFVDANGELSWRPEANRVQNVVVKLARGHIAYELSTMQNEDPAKVLFFPLHAISGVDRVNFENAASGQSRRWPEIGSRAFLRACGARPFADQQGPWVSVQPSRYRYSVDQHGGIRVQIVISEYLGCLIEWN